MRREDFDCGAAASTRSYFLHVEDVDLCWRVRRAGGEVLFHPKAEVIHLGHTSQTSPMTVEFHKGVGLARYFRKRADSSPRLAALAHVAGGADHRRLGDPPADASPGGRLASLTG